MNASSGTDFPDFDDSFCSNEFSIHDYTCSRNTSRRAQPQSSNIENLAQPTNRSTVREDSIPRREENRTILDEYEARIQNDKLKMENERRKSVQARKLFADRLNHLEIAVVNDLESPRKSRKESRPKGNPEPLFAHVDNRPKLTARQYEKLHKTISKQIKQKREKEQRTAEYVASVSQLHQSIPERQAGYRESHNHRPNPVDHRVDPRENVSNVRQDGRNVHRRSHTAHIPAENSNYMLPHEDRRPMTAREYDRLKTLQQQKENQQRTADYVASQQKLNIPERQEEYIEQNRPKTVERSVGPNRTPDYDDQRFQRQSYEKMKMIYNLVRQEQEKEQRARESRPSTVDRALSPIRIVEKPKIRLNLDLEPGQSTHRRVSPKKSPSPRQSARSRSCQRPLSAPANTAPFLCGNSGTGRSFQVSGNASTLLATVKTHYPSLHGLVKEVLEARSEGRPLLRRLLDRLENRERFLAKKLGAMIKHFDDMDTLNEGRMKLSEKIYDMDKEHVMTQKKCEQVAQMLPGANGKAKCNKINEIRLLQVVFSK